MVDKEPGTKTNRLYRVSEVIARSQRNSYHADALSDNQISLYERRRQSHDLLGKLAINDPNLGGQIFNSLRVSDDPAMRHYAACMVSSLFMASELASSEEVNSLQQDPDSDVRVAIDILVNTSNFGTDLDLHRQRSQTLT
jgi:hypothetical protein